MRIAGKPMAVIILLLSACSKGPELAEPFPDSREVTLHASMEIAAPDTRTALNSDYSTMVWSANDAISLFRTDGTYETFQLLSGAGETSATFSGSLGGDMPSRAFYPASGSLSVENDFLLFQLPQSQTFVPGSFAEGSMPMVASFDNISTPMQFKNLCGLLCLNLKSKPSLEISRIVVKDLGGNMLWGNASLKLDGNEGTSAQKMTLAGGNDEITVEMPSSTYLSDSAPTKIFVVVPPGSFDNGFSATVYDEQDNEAAVLVTDNHNAVIERSMISNMNSLTLRKESSDPKKRGFYKDLFMDSGIRLNPFTELAAFPYIGWDYEYFKSDGGYPNAPTADDALYQQKVFVSSEDDENGYLLYPDRQPRYRCLYINGGTSRLHGESLGATARQTIYDYVYNGGSYVGTCGGAFIACRDRDGESNVWQYLGIFPGMIYSTGIMPDTYTDLVLQEGCPLNEYYSIPAYLPKIRHHQGGYLSEKAGDYPDGTEIFMRYANSPAGNESVNGKVAIWAYKPDSSTGRMVLCGSHPEKEADGDGRNLFSAMLLYAADGNGTPPVKASLSKGDRYDCKKLSSENDPGHARIGDKQYHHFTIEIPEGGAHDIQITLTSTFEEDDLYLSVKKGNYAWFSEADYALTADGANKTLNIPSLDAGIYYISVYSPNTVTATVTRYSSGQYFKYTGKTHLLNGIPYSITADWE